MTEITKFAQSANCHSQLTKLSIVATFSWGKKHLNSLDSILWSKKWDKMLGLLEESCRVNFHNLLRANESGICTCQRNSRILSVVCSPMQATGELFTVYFVFWFYFQMGQGSWMKKGESNSWPTLFGWQSLVYTQRDKTSRPYRFFTFRRSATSAIFTDSGDGKPFHEQNRHHLLITYKYISGTDKNNMLCVKKLFWTGRHIKRGNPIHWFTILFLIHICEIVTS